MTSTKMDLPLDRLQLVLSHELRVASETKILDLCDARRAIGSEYDAEDFGNHIVEFSAFFGIGELRALGARRDIPIPAARTDFAPACSFVFMATLAFLIQERAASAAIQSAICHEFGRLLYFSHRSVLLMQKIQVQSNDGAGPCREFCSLP